MTPENHPQTITNTLFADTQPSVGIPRSLRTEEIEQIVIMLRIVECLPDLTSGKEPESLTSALRTLGVIQQNHCELAALARSLLSDPEPVSGVTAK